MNLPSDRKQLITNCQGLVKSLAWKIHRRVRSFVDLDDLIGYGQIGLAEAARDFDFDRGVQFSTYAYYRIRGSIFDGMSKMAWFRHADFHRGAYEHRANELLSADTESADTDLRDDAQWFRNTTTSLAMVYFFSSLAGDGDNTCGNEPESRVAESGELVAQQELGDKLRGLVTNLPHDEKLLIQGMYFEGLTLTDAAARIGISKAWASRLHARILRTLAASLTTASSETSLV